jgi:hypothetical protein
VSISSPLFIMESSRLVGSGDGLPRRNQGRAL